MACAGITSSLLHITEHIDLCLKTSPQAEVGCTHSKPTLRLLIEIQATPDFDNPTIIEMHFTVMHFFVQMHVQRATPDLSEASLRGLDLSRCDLSRADLRGADLRGVRCYGFHLSTSSPSPPSTRHGSNRCRVPAGARLQFISVHVSQWADSGMARRGPHNRARLGTHLCWRRSFAWAPRRLDAAVFRTGMLDRTRCK
jgi:Pentapeptide repeats (8 copies)